MKKISCLLLLIGLVITTAQAQFGHPDEGKTIKLPPGNSSFVIDGKTNVLVNGKAVINGYREFQLLKLKQDTVLIRNHSFVFKGTVKYPEELRIEMIGKGNNHSLSEPFFISAGYHKLTIDKASNPHDSLEMGIGVNLQNAAVNDEYIKKYVPLRNKLSKRIDNNDRAMSKCSSVKDKKEKKGCLLAAEAERESLRKSLDDILLTYTKANPKSPIVPWLLYDEIFYHGYNDCYQNAYKEFSKYTPDDINIPIRNFLEKKKLKTPGYLFPLTDFVKANVSKNISQNRYILVDFWFSGCAPCIAQFKELKETYKKYNKKGFEIIAISIDNKEGIPEYRKLIAKNGYVWPQVLDLNGVKTKTIDVNGFPSGFLLDSHWKIIKTQPSPDVLNSFLEDNLK